MAGINPRGATQDSGTGVGRYNNGWGITKMVRNRDGGYGDWEPTIIYLLVLVVVEFVAFASLRYAFRSVHGG